MSTYHLDGSVVVRHGAGEACYGYAVRELVRLLGRVGVTAEEAETEQPGAGLEIGAPANQPALPGALHADAYRIAVDPDGVRIDAPTGKGVLNGVYDLAEQWGYVFLLPGESGEWAPSAPRPLPCGTRVMNPRFAHRGVFAEALASGDDFPAEEWLRFYAKLRFNAVAFHEARFVPVCEELGLRPEIGGHGLSKLLPRDLFEQNPELFRMFQPEDFNGRRMKDANFCVTHPRARAIIREAFAEQFGQIPGVYAVHAWPDDLPAGGWCMCPRCRAFSPEDQAQLSMNLLAETTRGCDTPVRIPMLAYHDTLFPGTQIDPAPECFLLWAPRERCYGHALDDPECVRNRYHLDALVAQTQRYAANTDSHTFEYYFDQVLFRGMYPFLPDVILADMHAYERLGIASHMSLQVAGPELAPEYNMLLFARAHWEPDLTTEAFCRDIACALAGEAGGPFSTYLRSRGDVFADALRMCEHDPKIYLDYRWLPETVHPFGREMAATYGRASGELAAAADALMAAAVPAWPERVRALAAIETKRARFESAELHVMHWQQSAVNAFAAALNGGGSDPVQQGCDRLEQALAAFEDARTRAVEYGLPEGCWYFRNIYGWLTNEFRRKIAAYR